MKKIGHYIFNNSLFSSVSSVVQIVLLCCLAVAAQNQTTVRITAEATVEKDRIELGDLAELNENGANFERLKTVSLGYAPQPGATREILKEKIALAIAAAGFTSNEIALDCPPKILIRRASQKIGTDLLRAAIEKAVFIKFQAENIAAKIIRFDVPNNFQMPSGEISVRADLTNIRNFFAPFAAALEISIDNRVVRRIFANVQLEATADVLVATRNINAQEKINSNDFRLEPRLLGKPLSNYLRDTNKLRGMVLLKNISAGSELTRDAVVTGVAIKTGDPVRITGQSGKLQISIAGEARGSGRIGDRIAVKNRESGAVLQAVVVDEGLVKISF